MIVVGGDFRPVELSGKCGNNPQAIRLFVCFRAQFSQFGGQGVDAIGFLMTDVGDAGDLTGPSANSATAAKVCAVSLMAFMLSRNCPGAARRGR